MKMKKELDTALHSHPCLMTAMTANRKKLIKALKKAPGAHLLRKGEVSAMADSGAGVPGVSVDKHCPLLCHKLREATKKIKCVTANGGGMVVDQAIELNVELDGFSVSVKLSELPIQCPILSVKQIVKRGNMVVCQGQGRFIVHKTTGRKINFVERDGVYVVRMTFPYCTNKDVEIHESGFKRPGR